MAGFLEQLQIIINADAKGAVKGFGQASAAAETSGKSFMGFKASTGLVVAGVVGVAAALYGAAKAYDAQQVAELKLQNSLKNNPNIVNPSIDAYTRLASSIQDKTAASDEEIISAQAMLGTFRMTEDQILTLTPLVVDYARKFGVDMVSAATQVGKAFDGSVGALKRNGVTIDENLFKTDRYGAIVQALRSQVGGFAREEAQTFSGSMERLKNQLGEVAEAVGGQVAPVLADMATGLGDAAKEASGLISSLLGGGGGEGLGNALEFINNSFNPLMVGLNASRSVFKLFQGDFEGAGNAALKSLGPIGNGIAGLTKTVEIDLAKAGPGLRNFGQAFSDALLGASDITRRTTTEIWALIDAELALEGSSLAVARAGENYQRVLTDGSSSLLDVAEAEHRYKAAIDASAKAAGDKAVLESGFAAGSKQADIVRTEAQTSALLTMATQTAGPVRDSILNHVLDLNRIPPEKRSEILALINSGQVAAAEAQLNFLARNRTASIGVSLTGMGAAVARNLGLLPAGAAGVNFHPGGPILVGEKGPEIVNLPEGSQVIPNDKSMAMLRRGSTVPAAVGGGSSRVFNIHVAVAPLANPADTGRQVVDAIRDYELVNGTGWRN